MTCTIFSGLGIATLGIGMVVRLLVSFFAVWGTNLNMKERLFIPFAWLPKATVQVEIFLNPTIPFKPWHDISNKVAFLQV